MSLSHVLHGLLSDIRVDCFFCQRKYRVGSENVLFTHGDHGHVNFEQPLVVPCGAGSGCVIGSDPGTGAPTTRVMDANKAMIMCFGDTVVSWMLKNSMLQFGYGTRDEIEEIGRAIVRF